MISRKKKLSLTMAPPKKVYWLHCNRCFALQSSGVQLYMSSCFHVLCHTCINNYHPRAKARRCYVCGRTPLKETPIHLDLPLNVSRYFKDFPSLLRKAIRKIEFRIDQRIRFANWITKKREEAVSEEITVKKKLDELRSMVEKATEENKRLHKQREELEAQLRDLKTSSKPKKKPLTFPMRNTLLWTSHWVFGPSPKSDFPLELPPSPSSVFTFKRSSPTSTENSLPDTPCFREHRSGILISPSVDDSLDSPTGRPPSLINFSPPMEWSPDKFYFPSRNRSDPFSPLQWKTPPKRK